jgi:hypothetical protein
MRFGIDPARQTRNDHETRRGEFPREATSGLASSASRRPSPNDRDSRFSERTNATANKQHRGRIDELRQRPRISRIRQWHDSQPESFTFSQTPLASIIRYAAGDVWRQKFQLSPQLPEDFSRRHPFAQPNPNGFWLPSKGLLQLQPVESLCRRQTIAGCIGVGCADYFL